MTVAAMLVRVSRMDQIHHQTVELQLDRLQAYDQEDGYCQSRSHASSALAWANAMLDAHVKHIHAGSRASYKHPRDEPKKQPLQDQFQLS